METLFKDYQKSILPSCDGASTVQLRIGIAVRQIVELVSPIFPTCDGASAVQLRIGIAVRHIVELVKPILPSCDGASTVQLRIGVAVRQIVELVSPKFNTDEINSSCKYTPGNYSQLSLIGRPCNNVIIVMYIR